MRPIVLGLTLCIVMLWIGNTEAKTNIRIKIPPIIVKPRTTTTRRPTTKKASVKVANVKTMTSIPRSTSRTPVPLLNATMNVTEGNGPCFNFTDPLPWTPTAFNETDRTFSCTETDQLCGTHLSLSVISLLFQSEGECHQKGAIAYNNTYSDWKPRLNTTVLHAPSITGSGTLSSLLSMLMGNKAPPTNSTQL